VNANLKLYAAVMGKHVPTAAYDALGPGAQDARALAVASHKGLAMRAAENAGIKVNLNGWRVAAPVTNEAADVVALLRTKMRCIRRPGEVLLSRSSATGFVARFNHAVQRWTRVAELVGNEAVLLPGAVNEMRWASDSTHWQIDAQAWRARVYYGGERYGEWLGLDTVLLRNHFPRKLS
jgi:hypothetical protein